MHRPGLILTTHNDQPCHSITWEGDPTLWRRPSASGFASAHRDGVIEKREQAGGAMNDPYAGQGLSPEDAEAAIRAGMPQIIAIQIASVSNAMASWAILFLMPASGERRRSWPVLFLFACGVCRATVEWSMGMRQKAGGLTRGGAA